MTWFRKTVCVVVVLFSFIGSWLHLGHTRYLDLKDRSTRYSLVHTQHISKTSEVMSANETDFQVSEHHHSLRDHFPSLIPTLSYEIQVTFFQDCNSLDEPSSHQATFDIPIRPPCFLS